MTKFIKGVNAYLSQMKIKQTYISLKTGIDIKKLSRVLTGVQDISGTDMEKIAKALGKDVGYFFNDPIVTPRIGQLSPERMAFYAGDPTEQQEELANKLVKLVENIDEVISAKQRFLNLTGRRI